MLTLIERLEQATGPDRELDARIHLAVTPDLSDAITDRFTPGWIVGGNRANPIEAPAYTASLDATVALVERCLPDAEVIAISRTASGGWGAGINGHVKTGAINGASALLIALLRALEQEP